MVRIGEGVAVRGLGKSGLRVRRVRMSFQILRDDGFTDSIAGQRFESFDEAYAVLERYYADLCCSDDRIYYRIEEVEI